MVRLRWGMALLLGGASALTGCVTYTPVELDVVPPGEEVRVRLTDDGAVRAARHLGRLSTEFDAAFISTRITAA